MGGAHKALMLMGFLTYIQLIQPILIRATGRLISNAKHHVH
jgi:hypothetical protein